MNPLVVAIPVFLVLAALEAAAAHRRRGERYKLGDLVSGLGCGTLDQVVNLAVGAGFLAVYAFVNQHVALFGLGARSAVTWIAAVPSRRKKYRYDGLVSATGHPERNLILPSPSIQYAKDRARQYVDQARAALATLPDSHARQVLDTMAEFVITRPM